MGECLVFYHPPKPRTDKCQPFQPINVVERNSCEKVTRKTVWSFLSAPCFGNSLCTRLGLVLPGRPSTPPAQSFTCYPSSALPHCRSFRLVRVLEVTFCRRNNNLLRDAPFLLSVDRSRARCPGKIGEATRVDWRRNRSIFRTSCPPAWKRKMLISSYRGGAYQKFLPEGIGPDKFAGFSCWIVIL